jgi:hypothetical protein
MNVTGSNISRDASYSRDVCSIGVIATAGSKATARARGKSRIATSGSYQQQGLAAVGFPTTAVS